MQNATVGVALRGHPSPENINGWPQRATPATIPFSAIVVLSVIAAAAFASWLPLQVSIVTLFLFAGPHNWFELRYFLTRLPVRFGRSRNFFLTAFAGLGLLTLTYVSLPFLYNATLWSEEASYVVIALWNTALLFWLTLLVWLRSKQKRGANWKWTIPVGLALCSLNWLGPDLFSLAIVYVHPLIAFWFLDRHILRTRPAWSRAYRRCLWLVPLVLAVMIWQLSATPALADNNGLFWRITQHSGAEVLPQVSSHMLVSVHLFLEMLHYGVWIIALPLIGRIASARFWEVRTVPIARHPKGFPRIVACALVLAVVVVVGLWFGFSIDYSTTRDIYFTVAIAHVLAEAPFLLRML
ncbi:MAG TPA: hypothetical protein VKB05_11455 [Pyrinomonadaceae bacterium]|nr:hypothetical protein [Pyrinomonadaceae bacterium]